MDAAKEMRYSEVRGKITVRRLSAASRLIGCEYQLAEINQRIAEIGGKLAKTSKIEPGRWRYFWRENGENR
jgi:hypothetical protein